VRGGSRDQLLRVLAMWQQSLVSKAIVDSRLRPRLGAARWWVSLSIWMPRYQIRAALLILGCE